jgi:methionyl-tRNA formyltransferase
VFIGNESPYLQTIGQLSRLSKIVCEPIRGASKFFFGSAYQFAKERKIEIVSPASFIRSPGQADIIIVSGYSKLVPQAVIESSRVATVNIHQSLLPAYRGRHPLNWAIINGENLTGITIHHISKGFDEGNIILQEKVKILDSDTVMDLYWRTVEKGCELLHIFFRKAKTKNLKGFRQSSDLASYFPPRAPRDGKIDWKESAEKIYNLVRALAYPYPGAYFYSQRRKLVVEVAQHMRRGPSGAEIGIPMFGKSSCLVKTGSGFLKILQFRNKKFSEIRKQSK